MIWILLTLSIVSWTSGHSLNQPTDLRNSTLKDESVKGRQISNYVGMINCVANYDVSCFLDVAEDYLELRRTELLAEADAEAVRSTGRADPDSKPSYLADLIGKLIKEFGGMFRDGFGGFMQSREGEDDDESEDSDEEDDSDSTEVTARVSTGDARGKKKKKKNMLGLLKFFGFATLIYKKICLLLKLFHAALQFKFFLLALAGFLLHLAKLWLSFKHEHHPTKVIYYEHAQHQHHYGHGEEDGHSIWARALHMDNSTAQKSAYAAQKPIVLITVTDKAF